MTIGTMRIAHIVAWTLVAGWIAQPLIAEEIERDYHETFEIEPGMRLVLEHGDGDVEISPWNQDTLEVTVRYRAHASSVGWSKSTDFEVEFRQDGDTISIVAHEPKRVNIGVSSYREEEYRFAISAPSYLELHLEGDDGDVEIDDWNGPISMKLEDGNVEMSNVEAPRIEVILEDGDLEIDGIRGDIDIDCEDGDVEISDCQTERGRIRTEDGDITVDRCQGSFEISVSDGDAYLTEMTVRDMDIRSGDGTIKLALLPAEDLDVKVRVGDGDVVVDLDQDISATFELETRDGRIRLMAEDVSNLQQNRRRTTGQLGSGEGAIYIRTDDGSLTLRQ
jgi:DUF4097 and DUF4098 domain-containing protein YvlB